MRKYSWLAAAALLAALACNPPAKPRLANPDAGKQTSGPAGASGVAQAAEDAKAGTAPPLKIAQWVKGQPIQLSAGRGKNVYVVEFWATWCPPCRTSIPHLTELQKKYKNQGVVIVGITNEPAEKVKPFVAKMGDKMDYTVAVDDNQATSKAYMEANGVGTIPHAFVVNKSGDLVWHGHPMQGLEDQIEKALKK